MLVPVWGLVALACSASGGDDGGTGGSGGGVDTGVGGSATGGSVATSGGASGDSGGSSSGGLDGSGGVDGGGSEGFCATFANGSGTTQPCYVGEDGKAYCIADDGSTTALSGLPGTAINATGQNFTTAACAVNDQGAVHCGQYAQVGTGTAFVASGATQVSGSLNGQCALAGSTITCAGVDVASPTLPSGTPVQLACYYHGCCALSDAGEMYCWGDTTAIGGTSTDVRAVNLPDGKKAIGMGPGQDHICALLEGGQVQCWGKDWNKQLGGLGENSDAGQTLAASGAIGVAAGQFHTCIAYEDGHVECISTGQSEGAGLDMGTFTAVSNVTSAVAITAGKHYTCALESDRTVKCWGRIGGGTTPVTVTGPKVAACP